MIQVIWNSHFIGPGNHFVFSVGAKYRLSSWSTGFGTLFCVTPAATVNNSSRRCEICYTPFLQKIGWDLFTV